MILLAKNFYHGMLLQELYEVFGAANLFSEDVIADKLVVKYLFYYIEEKGETYIFTFQFIRPIDGHQFTLCDIKKVLFKKFYKYEKLRDTTNLNGMLFI